MTSRKRISVSSTDSSLTIELPKAITSPVVSRLPAEKTDRKVVKIGKHIQGIRKEYHYDKLMSWNLDDKGTKARVYWVDIHAPSKNDVDALGKKFNLHPVTIDDINEPDIEKIEPFEDRGYVFFHFKELHYRNGTNELITSWVHLLVFKYIVISLHSTEVFAIEQILRRIQTASSDELSAEKCLKTGSWVLYALLDTMTDGMDGYVQRLVMEADTLDELVLVFSSGEQEELLRRIDQAFKLLLYLKSHVRSKLQLASSLTTEAAALVDADIAAYLRDVKDSLKRMDDRLKAAKDTLNNLHSTYIAKISMEHAENANQANGIMRTFSAVSTLFMPLSFVTALFGMNVHVPGLQCCDHYEWFFGLLGGMIVLSLGVMIVFRRFKYF